jgi:hypothetical protein
VLAYLDALIDALSVRDSVEVERLLAHPLVRILPDAARDEARALMRPGADALAAPLRVMQLRHATAELLRDAPILADQPEAEHATAELAREQRRPTPAMARRTPRLVQMELPLSA